MKLLRISVTNFGSYPSLELDLADTGLALIHGPTGAGKSTVMDAAAWVLYGTTAKGGAVDQVRSWQTPHNLTRGTLDVELTDGRITVTRVRGKQPENDLYWAEQGSHDPRRGKDLKDTQRLLDQRLGSSAALFQLGAYFHEFSSAGQFFTSSAKDRRSLFERIADTSLPDRLSASASDARREAKRCLEPLEAEHSRLGGVLATLKSRGAELDRLRSDWDGSRQKLVSNLHTQSESFETVKAQKIEALETRSARWEQEKSLKLDKFIAQIESVQAKIVDLATLSDKEAAIRLSAKCPSCGALDKKASDALYRLAEAKSDNLNRVTKVESLKEQLGKEVESENPFTDQIEAVLLLENHYSARAAEEADKINPYIVQSGDLKDTISGVYGVLKDTADKASALEHRVALLTRLYDLSATLRGELLKKAVADIEGATNRYMETYFDAELRVSFQLEADDLEVSIQKSGYDCVYPQLSKGQRQLLKLAFGTSVMKASANAAGLHFSCLFFDEALDGLDATLKVKAFSLLEELSLEHESVLVIDHATELKEMFSRRYAVTLVGDESHLENEDQ